MPSKMKIAAALLGVSAAVRVKKHAAKSDCFSKYDGQSLLDVSAGSTSELEMMNSHMAKLGCTDSSDSAKLNFQAICDSAGTSELLEVYKDHIAVVEKDAGEYFRSSSGNANVGRAGDVTTSSTFFSQWQDLTSTMNRIESAVAGSSGVATLETVGTSVEGRPIKAVRVRGPNWTSGSPRVVMSFQLHAREWITGMSGVYTVEKVIEKAKQDPDWISNMEVVLLPQCNPDGMQHSVTGDRFWRKNRAVNKGSSCLGVDLNRNWDPDWGGPSSTTGNPCRDTFYGSSAFSEPETQAVKGVVDEAPVDLHLDVHSYGDLILAPWSYKLERHPRRAEIDVLGFAMKEAIRLKTGNAGYTYGGSEVLYPASGVCPDYATSTGGIGLTLELRPGNAYGLQGFAPPPREILPAVEETWDAMLQAFKFVKGEPLLQPSTPAPTPTPPGCPPFSRGPDNDGDCRCLNGKCSTDQGSTFRCPTSGSPGGWGGRYFLPSCLDCKCYS